MQINTTTRKEKANKAKNENEKREKTKPEKKPTKFTDISITR